MKNGLAERARRVLARIGGAAYAAAEVADMQHTLTAEEIQHVRFQDLLEPKMFRILLVGATLAVLQQWSGINVIFNYAEEIFHAAGYGVSSTLFNIVLTGVVALVFTLIAIRTVDRLGRRGADAGRLRGHRFFPHADRLRLPVPSEGAAGGRSRAGDASACYSFSLAPVTWVLISEIFPNRIRGAAVSVAVSSLWIACFILTYTFPLLNQALGPAGTFWLYAGICAAGFVFILFCVPETKGKSLEQIERELVD